MVKKKLSRRDAIKLLGAASGATLLANLPSKWNKPELTSGVLPAHAQTSCTGLTMEITAVGGVVGLAVFQQTYPPDQTTGSGGVGTIYSWNCRGCIEINAGAVGSSSGSIDVLFTTQTNSQVVQYVMFAPSRRVYVNTGTGIISVDDSGVGAQCA